MHKKKDNRGSAMIIIIVVIAFVSILVSTLYAMVTMNIQMKSVDRKAKKSFYSAEGALEQINLGLQKEMSTASVKAYAEVMQGYVANVLEADRRLTFNTRLITDLQSALKQESDPDKYKKEKLESYLTPDVAANTEISSDSWSMVKSSDNSSLVLKGVVITYTDAEGFQSVIETDIRVKAPNLNFIQPSDMPDIFEYSLVANKKLQGTGATVVDIFDNVYAGDGDTTDGIGIQLKYGDKWNFENAERVITKGSIEVPLTAKLETGSNTDLWAAELTVKQGELDAEGGTYVADDLILEGEGSTVTLGGAYYGYGNGTTLNNAGVAEGTDGNSSAILINGTQSTLDMTNLRRLLISGSAQIATGKATYDPDSLNGMHTENSPGLSASLSDNVKFSAGTYIITSVGRNKLWCSVENYDIVARTDVNSMQEWERFQLINNSDGTISFKDNNGNHESKYLSVQMSDYHLNASADTIGPAEKFTLGSVEKDGSIKYVLRAYVNDKFITVDMTTGTLYANRDKVTDDEQLFTFERKDSGTVVAEADPPVVTWTYLAGNQAYVTVGTEAWLSTKNPQVSFFYKLSSNPDYTQVDMSVPESAKYYAYYLLEGWNILWDGSNVDYYFTYNTPNGNVTTPVYHYTHTKGIGNVGGADLAGTTTSPKLADGVYSIEMPFYDEWGNHYIEIYHNGTDPWKLEGKSVSSDSNSQERIVLVNNDDGTVSFLSKESKKYASVQTSGDLIGFIVMNADSIGENEKFKIEYGDNGAYYRLKHGEQYVYLNRTEVWYKGHHWPPMVMSSTDTEASLFRFNWLEYTTEKGQTTEVVVPEASNTEPTYGMAYSAEDKATASFKLSDNVQYTLSSARLTYSIDGAADVEMDMPIYNGTASATISGLAHGTKVSYMIVYSCSDNVTRHVARSMYIHERKYGGSLLVTGSNENVNLGESIEVKSNQIAYLVPADCIGVNNGETLFGQNPMSAEDYVKLLTYDADDVNYPNFELVSYSKKIEGLNKTLDDYRTPGTSGYQIVFSQLPGGSTMVYFYVDFDSENASKYFEEYYEAHQDSLSSYMNNYVTNIKMSTYFTRLMLNGNMVYSENAASGGKINIRSNEGSGAGLTGDQQVALKEEETSYMKRYNALTTKLILDYGELTTDEKTKDLFSNIIRDNAFAGIPTLGQTFSTSYGGETIRAFVIDNEGGSPYVYDGTGDQQNTYLILASGDVEVRANYNGIIIAKGTITLKSGVNKIESNKERLRKILQTKVNDADPSSKTIVEQFFIDGEHYVLEEADLSALGDNEYADYATCISYENWTKR